MRFAHPPRWADVGRSERAARQREFGGPFFFMEEKPMSVTGYEARAYANLAEIARALSVIAEAVESGAITLKRIADLLEAQDQRRGEERK